MSRLLQVSAFVTLFVLAFALTGATQTRAPSQPGDEPPLTPLKVQIVLSKHQGSKLISSLPYTLSVAANSGRASSLRMGAEVPIALTTIAAPGSGTHQAMQSFSYRDVGTNIDCTAESNDDGTYRIEVTIEDSSVYAAESSAPADPGQSAHPSFRTFKATETLILRDGQSVQYTTATDKVSGEVVKVDITLTVEE